MSLSPPPSNDYSSREELLTSVKSWAAPRGYAVVIVLYVLIKEELP